MKVIYHDKLGRHLSIAAAALHLKLINKKLFREDLQSLPYFLNQKSPGTLLYIGLDVLGHEVYVLGVKKSFPIIRNAYLGLNRVFNLNQDFLFADVQPLANLSLRVFDLLNPNNSQERKPTHYYYQDGMLKGLEKALPHLIKLVTEVQIKLNEGGSQS